MKKYKIEYMTFGNFQNYKIFSFENMPTKEECKFWLWNILNTYEKHTLDWNLFIDDIEIIKVKEYIEPHGGYCNVGYPSKGICFTSKPTHKEE